MVLHDRFIPNVSEKHLKRQTYTLEIKIIFILIFSISVKDCSFKLITFNARLSFSIIEQDLRDWTQNGLFFFCRFSSYSKKDNRLCKKWWRYLFTYTIFLIWIKHNIMYAFIFCEVTNLATAAELQDLIICLATDL